MDDELKKHVERTRRVNIGQEVLEAKMKVSCTYWTYWTQDAGHRVFHVLTTYSMFSHLDGKMEQLVQP